MLRFAQMAGSDVDAFKRYLRHLVKTELAKDGMTQEMLAEKVGCSDAHISNIAKYGTPDMRLSLAENFATYFNKSIVQMFVDASAFVRGNVEVNLVPRPTFEEGAAIAITPAQTGIEVPAPDVAKPARKVRRRVR